MRYLPLLALVACAHAQHDPQLDQRLSVIEQRLDAQQRALDEMRHHDSDTELSALAAELEGLRKQLDTLQNGRVGGAWQQRPQRREPDAAAVYGVPIGTSPTVGSPKAKVTLIMVGEFGCPYCRKAWGTVEDLRKKYGADLRVAYKSFIVHPRIATDAAYGACAAAHQGKFHEMAELLWVKAFDARQFDAANIAAIAKQAHLDMKRYAADVAGPCPTEVKAENAEMTKFGVGATPSFFINGRFMAGAKPMDNIVQLVDEELKKANEIIQKENIPAAQYYQKVVVERGQKTLDAPKQ
jgi:protein-disulfide isomerase